LLKEFIDDGLCSINFSNSYIKFDNGSLISLNHCNYEADLENYLSAEFHILLIDESTTFTEKMIRFLRSRVRVGSLKVPEQFIGCLPFILYATNPRGIAHAYFKRHFVDAAEPDTPFLAPVEEGKMNRCFVPSLLSDNPHIEDEYADRLRGLGDPDVIDAYLKGDWSIIEGAALPTLSRKHHIVDATSCCTSWRVFRAYDYGYSAPYFVFFYMIASGESKTKFNPPKGSIIIHTEIYGADERDEGLKEDVAITGGKIRVHESLHYPYTSVNAGPADSSIFAREQGPSIADNIGVPFEPSDKTPGSRILGLEEARKYLYNAINFRHEKPGLYFTNLVPKGFAQLMVLQLDEKKVEDVDTNGNDHSWDVLRYIVLNKSKEIIMANVNGT